MVSSMRQGIPGLKIHHQGGQIVKCKDMEIALGLLNALQAKAEHWKEGSHPSFEGANMPLLLERWLYKRASVGRGR